MADQRPRPQYGEYASSEEQILAGGTPVAIPEPSSSAGDARALAAGSFPPPSAGTRIPDNRKSCATSAGAELAPEKRRFDSFFTTFLLSLSAFVVIGSSAGWADLPASLIQTYKQLGYGEFTSIELASTIGVTIAVVQSVLLIAAAIFSILRLRAKRASFWVPIVFSVVSLLVTLILMMIVMMTDPALAAYLATQP